MFKFLRKYNKWILAVGGTLLMIVFLIPQAIEGMAQRAGGERAIRATLTGPDGREIRVTWAEWSNLSQQADFLDRLDRQVPVLPGVGRLEGAGHWYLLVQEAAQAGLIPSTGSLDIPDEQLVRFAIGSGVGRVQTVREALANLEGVGRLIDLYSGAGEVSDHRLQQFAARVLHVAEAQIVPIAASAEGAHVDPQEQELQEQLDRYGDIVPGDGPMGFGYKLPDRVNMEWLSVSAHSVRAALVSEGKVTNVEVYRHWLRESRRPDTALPPYDTEGPIPDAVREHLLERLTKEKLEEIEKFANDHLRAASRTLQRRDGYAVLPDDWAQHRPPFAQLAEAIQERFGVALPAYRSTGRWIAVDDLDTLEGIGRASTQRLGATARSLRQIVTVAKEFGGSPLVQVQAGLAGPPLRDADGGVHVFRILEADATRPPHSVDEVRDDLLRDVRRLTHYDRLVEMLADIERQARSEGLLATALAHGTRVSTSRVSLGDLEAIGFQRQLGQAMTAVPRSLPGVGVNRNATTAIIDRAMNMPEGSLEEVADEERLFAVPVEDALTVLVVKLVRNQPVSHAIYSGLASANILKTMLVNEELDGGKRISEAFSYDSLVKRHNFRLYDSLIEEDEIELADAALGR